MDTNKLKLEITLAPPLPERRFLFICAQSTIKDLKTEIRRRLVTIIQELIAIIYDGFELMDDDLVLDLLSNRDSLIVVLREHIQSYYAKSAFNLQPSLCASYEPPKQASRPPVFISKKEHGAESSQQQNMTSDLSKKAYPAELLYADTKAAQGISTTCVADKFASKTISKSSRRSGTSDTSSGSEEMTTSTTNTSSSSDDATTTCRVCQEKVYTSSSTHVCFTHASKPESEADDDGDELPEKMPLDRLSVSDSFNTRVQSITGPEIYLLDDADPEDTRPGNIVAYKVLEITSDVTAVVSGYKIAEVAEVHEDGSLSVRILREFRHGKETSSPVGSTARKRRKNLLNNDSSSGSGFAGNNLVSLDLGTIHIFKIISVG